MSKLAKVQKLNKVLNWIKKIENKNKTQEPMTSAFILSHNHMMIVLWYNRIILRWCIVKKVDVQGL